MEPDDLAVGSADVRHVTSQRHRCGRFRVAGFDVAGFDVAGVDSTAAAGDPTVTRTACEFRQERVVARSVSGDNGWATGGWKPAFAPHEDRDHDGEERLALG